jgi:hypothetical protein
MARPVGRAIFRIGQSLRGASGKNALASATAGFSTVFAFRAGGCAALIYRF